MVTGDRRLSGALKAATGYALVMPFAAELGAATIVLNLTALALPLALLQIYDRVIPNQSTSTMAFLVLGVMVALVAEQGVKAARAYITGWIGARLEHRMGCQAFEKMLRADLGAYEKDGAPIQLERLRSIAALRDLYSGGALVGLLDLPFVLVYVSLVWMIGGTLAVVPVMVLFVFAGFALFYGKKLRDDVRNRVVIDDRRFSFLTEVLTGIHSVKSMAMETMMHRRYELLQESAVGHHYEATRRSVGAIAASALFSQSTTIMVVAAGGLAVVDGEITTGALAACTMLAGRTLQPLQSALAVWIRLQNVVLAKDRAAQVFALPQDHAEGLPPIAIGAGEVVFENVSFSFSPESVLLKELNLRIAPGECVAISGDNGSGKTTLLSLVSGISRPSTGRIVIDGVDIAGVDPGSLRRQVAFLPQQGVLFGGTILENITMFDERLNEPALAVAHDLGLDDVVAGMRHGWATRVGEGGGGENMPVGVRQRIAIARALVHKPRIILFDEANIGIDGAGDAVLRDYLEKAKGRCTMLLVTPRPSLVKLADRALSIQDGRVIAREDRPQAAGARPAATITDGAGAAPAAAAVAHAERPGCDDRITATLLVRYPKPNDATFCLAGLLTALGWRGDPRRLSEVLPHLKESLQAEDIRQVMANLNYTSRHLRIDLAEIDRRLMPCLFVPDEGPMLVVLQRDEDRITAFDGAAIGLTERKPTACPGSAYFFQPADDARAAEGSWSRRMLKRFLPHMWLGFGASVFINILALATPLFVMACYDFVIPAANEEVLPYLLVGAAIALAAEATFRGFRGHILAFVGARGTYVAGNAVFQRILALPVSFTERATVGSQVARIKDLEGLRDMFVGPLATLFFDLPTSLVFVAALALINPWLLLVVLAAALLLTLLTVLFYPALKERLALSSRAGSQRQEFLIDSLAKMRAIRLSAAETTWLERHRQVSARAIMADFRASLASMAMAMAAQTLIVLTGLATVSVCVFGALSGAISTGGIIASMMIVWRLLAPLQNAFTAVGTLVRAKASLGQMDALMRLKAESEPTAHVHATRTYRGQVAFNRVSFRYSHEADPALVGVTFQIEPGQVLAVAGSNGSGKSTTLKLLLGLYHAQAGSVRLDGIDLRQIDPVDLRRAISYVPQRPDFFYGTIAQNLRLAHPNATDAELEWALDMSGARDEVLALPRGLDTRILDGHADHMAIGLRQRLSLARAYLKPASLLLLDEPGNGLDFVGDRAFIEAIGRIRGRTTVVIVTHRPSHLRLADAVLYLQGGYGRAFGSFDTVAKQIGLDSL